MSAMASDAINYLAIENEVCETFDERDPRWTAQERAVLMRWLAAYRRMRLTLEARNDETRR